MAEKPGDNKPATEFGEVKVIKNEREEKPEPEKAPENPRDKPGKTPGKAEG
jgi:hypothetical protein